MRRLMDNEGNLTIRGARTLLVLSAVLSTSTLAWFDPFKNRAVSAIVGFSVGPALYLILDFLIRYYMSISLQECRESLNSFIRCRSPWQGCRSRFFPKPSTPAPQAVSSAIEEGINSSPALTSTR